MQHVRLKEMHLLCTQARRKSTTAASLAAAQVAGTGYNSDDEV